MARNTERRFTLRAAIRETISTGMEKVRRSVREAAAPLKQMVTGLDAVDRGLIETSTRAAEAGRALTGLRGLPAAFSGTSEELQQAAEAAKELERALDAVRRSPGAKNLDLPDARALRGAIRASQAAQGAAGAALAVPEGQRADSRELAAAAKAVERLRAAAPALERVNQALADQARQVGFGARAWRRLTASVGVAAAGLRGVRSVAGQVGSALRRMTSIVATAYRSLFSFRTLAVVVIGIAAARGVVAYADSYQELNNRLRLVTESQQELNRATRDVFDVSQRARTGLSTVSDTYFRLARGSRELREDQTRLASVTETIAKAVQLSGASADAADAALVQFGQGLAANALRGEELNSVLEQTPRLAQAIADGLGLTLGELREKAREGELTAARVIGALETQAGAVEAEFGRVTSTIGQALTRLDNAVGRAVGIFAIESGASGGIVAAINAITDALDKLVERFGDRLGIIPELVQKAFNPALDPAERERARAQLVALFEAAGGVLEAIFASAARVAVATISTGLRAVVVTLLPVVEDAFRDAGRDAALALPGGSLVAPEASLSKQLREAAEEAERLKEQFDGLIERRKRLEAEVEVGRSATPAFDDRGEFAREQRGLRRDLRDLQGEQQDLLRRRADVRANEFELTREIQVESAKRSAAIDASLIGIVDAAQAATSEASADVGAALDGLVERFETASARVGGVLGNLTTQTEDAGGRVADTAAGVGEGFGSMFDALRGGLDETAAAARAALAELADDLTAFAADAAAREAEALGRTREASRLRLVEAQRVELGEAPEVLRPDVRAVQATELERFDLDTQRASAVERVKEASEALIESERRLETQVRIGNLTRLEARTLTEEQRAAFLSTAEAANAELDALEERFPRFAALIAEARAEVAEEVAAVPAAPPPSEGAAGFAAGFADAARDLQQEATNTYRLAADLVGTLASSLSDGLVSAIDAGIRGTKSWGEAFRDWASDVLISIGQVLVKAALLAAVATALNAIAPGLGSALGTGSAAAQGANAGGVIGRAGGGSVFAPRRGVATTQAGGGGGSGGAYPGAGRGSVDATGGGGRLGPAGRRGGLSYVFGPRGANRDTVLTALTTGEVVWSRPMVDKMGGASAVMRFQDAVLGRLTGRAVSAELESMGVAKLPGFNRGGVVGPSVGSPDRPLGVEPGRAATASGVFGSGGGGGGSGSDKGRMVVVPVHYPDDGESGEAAARALTKHVLRNLSDEHARELAAIVQKGSR